MTRAAGIAALLALTSGAGVAQVQPDPSMPLSEAAAPVPFGPGERAVFRVTWGGLRVGRAVVDIPAIDTIRGHPAYHLRFTLKGGIPFAHVDNKEGSWLDVQSLYSLRFFQDKKEVRYKRLRTLDFFPEEGVYRWLERQRTDTLAVTDQLDDISFMYWARTQDWEVGRTYTFNRYFRADGNPVIVNVLRRDSVRFGEEIIRTVVLKPTIRTQGLFREGGEAELHFSDDDRRMLVFMSAKLSIGRLKLHLEEYTPGIRLSNRPFNVRGTYPDTALAGFVTALSRGTQ